MHSSTGPTPRFITRTSRGEVIYAYTDSSGVEQRFSVPLGCNYIWHNGRYQVFEDVPQLIQDRPVNPRQPTDQQGADCGRREAAD